MEKRGQIALYIIIGLALISAIGIFLVIRTNSSEIADTYVFPEAKTALQKFISHCIENTARDGLFLMGIQGGYVTVPEELAVTPGLHVLPSPLSPIRTPTWHFNGVEYMPTKKVMEEQLGKYISDNIGVCLQNLSHIKDENILVVTAPNATVRIGDHSIAAYLDYIVESSNAKSKSSLERFSVEIPISLTKIMETGKKVKDALLENDFLEFFTIDLMAASDPLIPMSGIRFSCNEQVWSQHSVQKFLQDILEDTVPKIRVRNTNHRPFMKSEKEYIPFANLGMKEFEDTYCDEDGCDPPSTVPSDQYAYNHLYLDAGLDQSVKDEKINIGFRYLPTFNMDMSVRPSNDGVMQSSTEEGHTEYLEFVCMNIYHFTYDVRYLVEVVVIQEGAYGGFEDFILRFAVPVLIDHNLPTESEFSSSLLIPTEENKQFCNATFDTEVHVYAKDKITNEQLNDAKIAFECVKFRCPIGSTRSELNGILRLTTNVPSGCYGGVITASKEGYVSGRSQVMGNEKTVEVELLPLRSVYYQIDLAKSTYGVLPTPLSKGQEAFVSLKSTSIPYDKSFIYDPEKKHNYLQVMDIGATYNLSVMVYDESTLIGGYMGTLRVDELNFNKVLTLHVYEELPHPIKAEDMGKLYKFLKDDDEYVKEHSPVWT